MFWFILYNGVLLPVLVFLVFSASIFFPKLKEGLKGRFQTHDRIKLFLKKKHTSNDIYWFHAASLGEFYQVKPIIEGMKKMKKDIVIFVSFSSPSGINYAFSDAIDLKFYLPFDFPWTIQKVLTMVKPKKVIFSTYDIWPNFVWFCKTKNIHLNVMSAKIEHHSIKHRPFVMNFYKSLYKLFDTIYAITEKDKNRFERMVGSEVKPIVSSLGNPRFDTIFNDSKEFIDSKPTIQDREQIILIGSSHSRDDFILIPSLINLMTDFPKLRIIHAPHEPSQNCIKDIKDTYSKLGHDSIILKDLESIESSKKEIIIVGEVGFLSKLYWLSIITYIGGGFSSGIHNIMEPAVASNPVVFGPNYQKFNEAELILKLGGGFCVYDSESVENTFKKLLSDKPLLVKSGKASFNLILNNIGSSERIINGILLD
ncbi:MAG: 3-deoxy-D-manno-octulosonic acid transferase [Candidatus Neomarinimicrobiota bacterium]